MPNILAQIIAEKRKEVDRNKHLLPIEQLASLIIDNGPRVRFSEQIAARKELHVISEFKRKSPSKPLLNATADVKKISGEYELAGASALSILTDGTYFGGSAADLKAAREVTTLPVLRKDFIIDPYQVYESKMMGADLILLIAEVLEGPIISQLTHLAHQLGLEVILEMHSKSHLSKIPNEIDFVGINNRDLRTFATDIQCSLEMARFLPHSAYWISESGIHTAEQALRLADAGYRAFLVGEQFMKTEHPGETCQHFVQQINRR